MPGETGEPSQEQLTGRINQPQEPYHNLTQRQGSEWTPQKVVGFLGLGKQDQWQALSLRPEPPIDPIRLQLRATQGMEAFKSAYQRGGKEWRNILTDTLDGEQLQAMYLQREAKRLSHHPPSSAGR